MKFFKPKNRPPKQYLDMAETPHSARRWLCNTTRKMLRSNQTLKKKTSNWIQKLKTKTELHPGGAGTTARKQSTIGHTPPPRPAHHLPQRRRRGSSKGKKKNNNNNKKEEKNGAADLIGRQAQGSSPFIGRLST